MSEETKPVFNAANQFEIHLRSAQGSKTVKVRFPTDEEWIERQRRRKVIIKYLGRGVSETTVPNSEETDAALVAKLRLDEDGPEVDPFEASRIVEQLSQAEVDETIREAGGFRVLLRVPGGTTVHVLGMPSERDVIQFRRAFARILDLPHNRQEISTNLRAAGELYQKLCQQTEGYADGVPIVHQAVAVNAVIEASQPGPEDTGNF